MSRLIYFHTSRYYGCGLAIPSKLEGMKVLDLGSGSGRDCFVMSKLVGQEGHVIGIDMTEGQVQPYESWEFQTIILYDFIFLQSYDRELQQFCF